MININSNEYKEYVNKWIKKYTSNNKDTVLIFCDAYFPIVDGVVTVIDNYAKKVDEILQCSSSCTCLWK